MQKCNFKFEILINDDCSTDGTTQIIDDYSKRYPDIIKPIYHNENQYSKGVKRILATFVYPKAVGKYFAICEGDDYWTDPYKLQKQVDLMEANPNLSFCHTAFSFLYEKNGNLEDCVLMPDEITSQEAAISILNYNKYRVQTCTVLFRASLLSKVEEFAQEAFSPRFLMSDAQLFVSLLQFGGVGYIKEKTSVYRVNNESACKSCSFQKSLRFVISCDEMRLYMMKLISYDKFLYKRMFHSYIVHVKHYLTFDPSYVPLFPLKVSNYLIYLYAFLRFYLNLIKTKIFS